MNSWQNKVMKWYGWGDAKIQFHIPNRELFADFLQKNFDRDINKTQAKKDFLLDQVRLPTSKMTEFDLLEIKKRWPSLNYSRDNAERIKHAYGKSYKDVIRLRGMSVDNPPDIVFFPENSQIVSEIIAFCSEKHWAVYPFGGGTSVVSGFEVEDVANAFARHVSIDLRGLNQIVDFNPTSRLIHVEAGIYGAELESWLNERGYTIGHFPQSFEYTTVGGWISARSSGQNSIAYGNIDKILVSLTMQTPKGILSTKNVPAMACGSDLRGVLVGSEGIFGLITSCVLRVRKLPQQKKYIGYLFHSLADATIATRTIVQEGIKVAMIRVSDEAETESMMALGASNANNLYKTLKQNLITKYLAIKGFELPNISMMIIGYEGDEAVNDFNMGLVRKIITRHQGLCLGRKPGDKWLKDRFYLPYLRDVLLDYDLLVDTLETATTWENLPQLYQKVTDAIKRECGQKGFKCAIYTHLSHIYEVGASLYFSIIAQQDIDDPIGQWHGIKKAASSAINDCGGAISHHHGIGIDHRPYLVISELEREIWRSVKKTVDPRSIMNPGKVYK